MAGPTLPTIKKLFAKSGNRCAFPRCTVRVVESNTIVADVCHICASSPLGPRYDPQQTETERHAVENLILLCAVHHRVVDDEIEQYPAPGLLEMKRAHEASATAVAEDTVDRTANLLAEKSTAEEAVNAMPAQQSSPAMPTIERAQRQTLLATAVAIHQDRLTKIVSKSGYIADLDSGRLIFHVIPVSCLGIQQSPAFAEISRNPNWFPPIAGAPRDWKVDFEGILIGSNGEGLTKPQRAYTHISRSGIVEVVASSLARGYGNDLIMLPQIQAMLIKYVPTYLSALARAGLTSSAVVCASLTGVNQMRLLHDFVANAIPEDIPGPRLTRDQYSFAETWMDTVPPTIVDAAHELKPTLDHMANAAGLITSPYFDAKGNYTLTP
jgi:hypothetical protein